MFQNRSTTSKTRNMAEIANIERSNANIDVGMALADHWDEYASISDVDDQLADRKLLLEDLAGKGDDDYNSVARLYARCGDLEYPEDDGGDWMRTRDSGKKMFLARKLYHGEDDRGLRLESTGGSQVRRHEG